MRTCYQRFDFIQSNGDFFVIDSVIVGFQFDPVFFTTLCFQECSCHFVTGEYGSGCTQFRAHVCDGCSLGNAQCFYTFTSVFHNFAYAAFYGQSAQHFQNHVFCSYPRAQFASQYYTANTGHCQIISTATHGNSYIQPTCADGKHTNTAAGRSMAVRAQQCFARFAETFQMYLMADAVARFGEINAVFFGYGLDVFVVVGVFEACLQCVVVNVCNRFFCFNSGNANGFKLQISHGTSGILC